MRSSMTDMRDYGINPMKNDKTYTQGATTGEDVSGLIQTDLVIRSHRDAAELEAITHAYNKHIYRARRKNQDFHR